MPLAPLRSLLFSPGANLRALDKAKSLPADGLIFDLEDSVAPADKPAARANVAAALADPAYGARMRLARINPLDTQWGQDDLAAAVGAGADGVLAPKVTSAADVLDASRALERAGAGELTRLWIMVETARALLDIAEIVRAGTGPGGRLAGVMLGTNDIARETGVPLAPGRGPMTSWISQVVLAARAYGLTPIDSVFNDFRDEDGLRRECAQGRDMGFDGKAVIHPAQLAIVNAVFGPTAEAIAEARAIVAAFEEPANRDLAVLAVDGRMVERLHLDMARRTLAMAAGHSSAER